MRRRIASGELIMICSDIAGVGQRNCEIGEVAVNEAITEALATIRSWRGVFFISQLNSGDEFVFIVDRADAAGLFPRIDAVFRSYGFNGAYLACCEIEGCYISSALKGMKLTYQQKNSEVRSQKSEVRSQESGVRSQESE
ncbi:MAG: hypothetical protein KME30_28845 [Iphinoe sp. HA4291-MV1]|jgi:hypothetical protein|nr:hypothetical protein [Iphinoe sp. HA4291-MV1]